MSLAINKLMFYYRLILSCSFIIICVFVIMRQHKAFAEYTSVTTDVYEVLVEKNGVVNINLANYTSLFGGIHAQIRYRDDNDFKQLRLDADKTQRFHVNNRLGRGQALALYGKDCEWQFHIYPGHQFFTVSLLYKNMGKSPVYVAALSPFSVGAEYEDVSPGNNAAVNIVFSCFSETGRSVRNTSGISDTVVLIKNKHTASVIMGGFLTQWMAETAFQVAASASGDDEELGCFRAICEYNPPICVLPGETLESEQLYITLASIDDYLALERYGAALAAVNNLAPANEIVPCGVDVNLRTCKPQQAIDVLSWQKQHLYRYGWNMLTLSNDWDIHADSNCICNDGIGAILDEAKNADMMMGVRLSPFLVKNDVHLLKEKPEWFLPYAKDNSHYVLNVALSDVSQWLTGFASKITRGCGFQTLVLEDTDCLLYAVFPPGFIGTRIQFYRQGLATIRKGISDDCNLIALPYLPAALSYVDAMGPRATWGNNWSETYGLDAALQIQSHLYATGVKPYPGNVNLENSADGELNNKSNTELQARLTAIALNGASVQLGNIQDNLNQDTGALLKCVSPPLPHAAFEIMEQEDATTTVRYLPLKTNAGEWHLVAFFNWSRLQASTQSINLNTLGLNGPTPYTLYEFFPGVYHGLLKDDSTLSVAPSSVRLFCLRPYANRPMLLTSDRHISQGALDHTDIAWSGGEKTLTGTFKADSINYCLRFLIPKPWKNIGVMVDGLENKVTYEMPDVMSLCFDVPERKKITWCLMFE